MDLEYDRKFEEMKKYIPFLENMIKRLEITSLESNPRQAQLDKIRSLRDLLMDKKKRMKMENLLKCEQVLVNLYEKVEQRESLPATKKGGNILQKDKSDLNTVRNKLKTAVSKLQNENVETLPEIARASETEEVCVPGSKEPALFQRRPNKSSMSPTRPVPNKAQETSPQMLKRNYTRVLLSPEPCQNNWPSEENSSEKPLFSRRSPRKSPRRRSPSYHRKERRKSSKNKLKEIEAKDLNITLNVPEESLNSLNTTDILSRIINCSDNDVDIDTLRELRTQILGELKETGANEDISDLILKSYTKKGKKQKKTEEVEEGELSDSESEVIESIYGSLVIVDKEKSSTSLSSKNQNEEKARKIQICLVINSDKNKSTSTKEECDKIAPVNTTDIEKLKLSGEKESEIIKKTVCNSVKSSVNEENILNKPKTDQVRPDVDDDQNSNIAVKFEKKNDDTLLCKGNEEKETISQVTKNEENFESKEVIKPNFYKPITEKHEQEKEINKYIPEDNLNNKFHSNISNAENTAESCKSSNTTTEKSNVEIPLLGPTKKVSEIDILQALKNEILGETNNVLSSEVDTPLLHQPKITKVINAHEIGSKKRISIENYKAKTTPLKTVLGNENFSIASKEDINKKQSLKLTEKECERFNFPSKLTLDGSSDDEDKTMDNIYENLAPKSPDHEDFADTGIKPPVIIPSDPVQISVVSSEADVDMRKILPVLQSNLNTDVNNSLTFRNDKTLINFNTDNEIIKNNDKHATALHDPRMKKDIHPITNTGSPNPYLMNVDITPRAAVNYINSSGGKLPQNVNSNSSLTLNVNVSANRSIMSPKLPSNVMSNITPVMTSNLAANMTPNRTSNVVPNMTPNARSYDVTPSRPIVDNDDFSNPKHVYAPMFPSFDTRDHNENKQWDSSDSNRLPLWEDSRSNSVHRDMDYRNSRNISTKRDPDYKDLRSNSLQRDMEYKPSYEQYQNGPIKDRYNYEKIDTFHRTDCQTKPIHPFGRLDCPATPTASFGRMDGPMTPVHCPSTPSHPFGRPDPILPMPFVRPDFNQHVPNQSYGKTLDPRLNRISEYDNYHNRDDDRERDYFQEPKFNSHSHKSDYNNRNNNSELYRRYHSEQSIGRNERNKNYDQTGRNYRESRRETNVGRYNRDYDSDRLYSRNRASSSRRYDYRNQNESKYDDGNRRNYQRERSVGRTSSRSSTRDSSVGRTFSKENQLSVQRHAGHSFTIDTSINSTFQETESKKDKYSNFDARRQRAASVGRTLVYDSSENKVSNDESKHKFKNLENKNKELNFRRACSVGREMKDSKLDFKDIKADLKSFKLRGESTWSKDLNNSEEVRKTTEVTKNFDPPIRKEIYKNQAKFNEANIKYSPRRNNRDPRMRSENSSEKKIKDDYRSKSKDNTKYGIVYSNDNITKGTILGPGYGVKNYKIPKIKRPHEAEVKNECNESKTKNITNVEPDTKIYKSKTSLDKKDSDKKESNFSKSIAVDIKHKWKDNKVEVTDELNKSRAIKYELDPPDKDNTTMMEKSKVTDAQDCKTNDSNTQEVTDNNFIKHVETENTSNLANTSIGNVEKRITRSVSKNLSIESVVEISPVKRTKRGKKSHVDESELDDNGKKMENTKSTNSSLSNKVKNIEKTNNKRQNSSDVVSKIKDLTTQEDLSNAVEKLDNKKTASGIDNSFAIDDLEIFSDNIASDPVMDNINALIADLDHDLDSAKSVDTNSNFTRELTLETMLENITSPEGNEKKLDPRNISPESPESEKDNDTKFKFLNESEITYSNEKKESESTIIDSNTSKLVADENNSTPKLNHQGDESLSKVESKNLENLQCETISVIERKDNSLNNLETQDIQSNEAIVSTSEDGEIRKIETQLTKETKDTKVDIQTTPDSTINSNINNDNSELQRNLPDSTNDLNNEMNSVISSTHNTSEKDVAEPSSSNTSASIESIGKLLSILQDKTKIKELLTLLGDQSNENEKIKKKLEKLSEIVSDDEESIREEKELEKIESTLNEPESENCHTILQVEEKNEMSDKDVSNVGSSKENLEETSNVSNEDEKYSLQENEDKERKSGTNEEKIQEIIDSTKDIINDGDYLSQKETENSDQLADNSNKTNNQDDQAVTLQEIKVTTKKTTKNSTPKKGRKKTKAIPFEDKRLTRSDAANLRFDKPIVKKPSRELQKLQEDIREMFIRDDILSATGIRMCRLAKLVDETKNQKDETSNSNHGPVVVLKKCNDLNRSGDNNIGKVGRKKSAKGKRKSSELNTSVDLDRNPINKILTSKLGSSSAANTKTNLKENVDEIDPYVFETDSINESNNTNENKNESKSSESESESLGSSKSFGSTELLAEMKKKGKRKRAGKGWQAGIIKLKNKRKKMDRKQDSDCINEESVEIRKNIEIPDSNCFTDKSYCFSKNMSTYDCRLCSYNGVDIVYHYKKQHPHSEIPLSRMNPDIAMEAIKESEKMNFQVISKISSKRYICRFCFKEFGRKKPVLESFFWHVVSMHTGEYKQLCSECLNVTRCPFNLDIPPPPKDNKGQLLGYVCEKCNYTQISLENLKTHVIIRHNDEQTAVYTINLSVVTKSIMNNLLIDAEDIRNTSFDNQLPRVLRSSRSNQSIGESWDVKSDSTEECSRNTKKRRTKSLEKETVPNTDKDPKPSNIQFKITFENDNTDEISNFDDNEGPTVKVESESNDNQDDSYCDNLHFESGEQTEEVVTSLNTENPQEQPSHDIFNYAHFKIKYSESGSKEYICCINGKDLHYRTTLLISFKKHVQLKHSENWDGYCFICKVIVTPQGVHLFKDCLQHFLDQHIDNFPVLEEITPEQVLSHDKPDTNKLVNENVPIKSYINVRPLSELISDSGNSQSSEECASPLPIIESVVSLGVRIEQSRPSPSYPKIDTAEIVKQYRYEEVQAELMLRKHRVVLEAMMSQVKLVQVFKCAGRFCSFTTDSAEDALLHASTHTRVGGEDSLKCVYCDYDSSNNAIDLITHVFKSHGCCQYTCGTCFYRAAASQLVNAHIKRVHAEATTVAILHTTVQTAPIKEENILSREAAVPYYLCCATGDSEVPCKFRTYTPGKFCEHLQIRHSAATEHSCFMCSATLSTPADLIRHLKTHGLKLYQCTWCVFGADNETELLAHASASHPDKQPKAYLRIITNKEGTSEFRVLPLAHLNKSDIPAIEVTPSNNRENPVREAERSIELEKLIGHTTLMIETMGATVEGETTEKESSCVDTGPEISEPFLENLSLIEKPSEQLSHRMTTPSPQIRETTLSEIQATPIIKTETLEMIPGKISQSDPNVVYCLDSDEEDAAQNIIDLSSDQSSSNAPITVVPSLKILPIKQLFLCSKCKMTTKSGGGFRKHITACFSQIPDPIPCAHCSMKLKKKNIVTHYTKTHAEISENYPCFKCPNKFTTLALLREHERNEHTANSNNSADNAVAVNIKPVSTNRRKRLLVSKDKTTEPPEKLKRFGPLDVNLLPINPILDDSVYCSLCEFSTKVRLNMVRHLQLHAEQQPVPQTAPVNPVPHLETNEKHFDKMVNLASSSIVSRTPEKSKSDNNTAITLMISPEIASRYPKYVSDKHRHTCGAKGCSYISVDESMFKCHWETLHSDTKDFRCVHCPPHQHLDTTKPLTAVRIIAHLKMHNTTLYACSLCSYYHYKRQIIEKHLLDIHKGGQIMVVREENNTPIVNTSQTQISAPTMDLKPWQCGLCKFKSLLRPEVVDHCAKIHNSKMQYKCAYCAFRTSNSENITKHQQKSHSGNLEEIFYYYYREGSVPDDPDGTPRWQKQSQKCNVAEPTIKSEIPAGVVATTQVSLPLTTDLSTEVDLNLVKKEVIEPVEESIEDLCKDFGEFCEPNGLKYKCSLCKNVEDSAEAMQSHLFEELKYRKWGCSICSYKAFHKAGLYGHMQIEHRQNREPLALEVDNRVETWVTKLLEYQTEIIEKYKENLAKNKEEIMRVTPGPSRPKSPPKLTTEGNKMNQSSSSNTTNKPHMAELKKIFGELGDSVNMSFCCPKCQQTFKEEDVMQNHLECELNKIRWFCSNCSMTYQTYHEAQFHCRTVHQIQSARPVEVIRDPTIRSAWIEAVISTQRLSMNNVSLPSESFEKDNKQPEEESDVPENSLLVVRYEENIPIPEELIARKTPVINADSDDDKLVIDEPVENKKASVSKNCPYCTYCTLNGRVLRDHILRHYSLRPFTCAYCDLNGSRKSLELHTRQVHQNQPIKLVSTRVPAESPSDYLQKQSLNLPDTTKVICLVCQNAFTEAETSTHIHDNIRTSFGKKGEVVVKCSICLSLHKDVNSYFNHHKKNHGSTNVNYVFSKLEVITNESKDVIYACSSCDQKFTYLKELKIHADTNHGSELNYTTVPNVQGPLPTDLIINLDEEENDGTENNITDLPPSKKVARKSTTKLPLKKTCARKSTTKLPSHVPSEPMEFSYYGTRPTTDDLDGVTTMMSFCNTMVPFTYKKLSEIININPEVLVEVMHK